MNDAKFVDLMRKHWGGRFKGPGVDSSWRRVVQGCEMLIDNCCDPDSNVLEWRKDVVELMLKHNSESEPSKT